MSSLYFKGGTAVESKEKRVVGKRTQKCTYHNLELIVKTIEAGGGVGGGDAVYAVLNDFHAKICSDPMPRLAGAESLDFNFGFRNVYLCLCVTVELVFSVFMEYQM